MPAPRVSVIIATYNWSTVLPYSIGSVLRQTMPDMEVLVVGDGCTDDSEQVVAAINDPRVRWINLPANTGQQAAPNNEGLRQARGEYIAYLGHDDLWLPHHLACLIAAIEAGADLAYGLVRWVTLVDTAFLKAANAVPYSPGAWLPPTSVLHRRAMTESVGGWRDYRTIPVNPETDLWRRAYEAGQRFVQVPRLTAIKFPAAHRKDAYKLRLFDEQAAWTERMQNEPDFEAMELGTMLIASEQHRFSDVTARPYRLVCADFVRETRKRVGSRLSPFTAPFKRHGHEIDHNRKFKGVDAKP